MPRRFVHVFLALVLLFVPYAGRAEDDDALPSDEIEPLLPPGPVWLALGTGLVVASALFPRGDTKTEQRTTGELSIRVPTDEREHSALNAVGFVAGGAMIVAGVILIASSDEEHDEPPRTAEGLRIGVTEIAWTFRF